MLEIVELFTQQQVVACICRLCTVCTRFLLLRRPQAFFEVV